MTRQKLGRIAAAVLALVGIGLLVVSGVLVSHSKVSSSRPTQGVLVKRSPAAGGLTRLEFSYSARGKRHTLTQSVPSRSPNATIPVGGKHVLFYDRKKPGQASLERPSLLVPLTLAGAAAIVFAGAGLLFYLMRGAHTT